MSETITKYYSLGSALMQYGQVNGETNPNATTMQAMQAYMKQNGDTLGNIVESFLWQPSTAYVVNAEVKSPNLPAGYTAICTTAGTTGTIEPDWSTSYSTYTDGTVTWSIVSQKEQILQLDDDKVEYDDVLTLEEIEASTSLADTDVASASAVAEMNEFENIAITAGTSAFNIIKSRGWRRGKHIHIMVFGQATNLLTTYSAIVIDGKYKPKSGNAQNLGALFYPDNNTLYVSGAVVGNNYVFKQNATQSLSGYCLFLIDYDMDI